MVKPKNPILRGMADYDVVNLKVAKDLVNFLLAKRVFKVASVPSRAVGEKQKIQQIVLF